MQLVATRTLTSRLAAPVLTATPAGATSIQLTWTPPPTTGQSVIAGVRVYGSTSASGPFSQIASSGTSILRTGLTTGTPYYYYAEYYDQYQTGLPCSTVSAIPIASGTTIKWNPGNYIFVTPSTWTSLQSILDQIATFQTNPNIEGVQLAMTMAALEGPAKGQYSTGIANVLTILTRLQQYNKKLILLVKDAGYGGVRGGNPSETSEAWFAPQYLMSDPAYGNSGPPYGIAYSGPGVAWSGNLVTAIRLWDPVVNDRMIALYQAYASAFDGNPYFEMMGGGETSLGVVGFGYSTTGHYTQLKRLLTAADTAFAHTQIRLPANFVTGSSVPIMLDLINHCASLRKCAVGGPDPELTLPLTTTTVTVSPNTPTTVVAGTGTTRTIMANELFRGNTIVTATDGNNYWKPGGGNDLRGRIAWVGETQNFGLDDRVLTNPVSLLLDYHRNVMHSSYIVTIKASRFDEVQAAINANPNVYSTAFPTDYDGIAA